MGYHTEFTGQVAIVPPLNPHEVEYLDRFAETRHLHRAHGPYVVDGRGLPADDVLAPERPPPELPGHWCHWTPSAAGDAVLWNGSEKFRHAEIWLAHLIDTFLKPGAAVTAELSDPVAGRFYPPAFHHFTFDHVLNGVIHAEGEEPDDLWRIDVRDNVVHVVHAVEFPGYDEIDPRDPSEWTPVQWAEYDARALRNHLYVVKGGEVRALGPASDWGFAPVAG